jgi:rfaE bifunctional protein kinase chain/domain
MSEEEILRRMADLRVLVAGDVCLDRWCTYDPGLADVSRETGIPRVGAISSEVTPGAAGTVASNVAALGARVSVLGAMGRDGFGQELAMALDARGIGREGLLEADGFQTFTYTKLINSRTGAEDLPRVDFVNTRPLPGALERDLVQRLEHAAGGCDVLLVSDQAETSSGGVVTGAVREVLARIAGEYPNLVVWVDSRERAELFRRAVVKCNEAEASAASERALGRVDYEELRRRMEAPLLIVTHGAEGALLVDGRGPRWVRARRIENPVDICGAGDSFSAGAAMALRVTGDPIAAARFGHLVASITVMKKGTGTASPREVMTALQEGAR